MPSAQRAPRSPVARDDRLDLGTIGIRVLGNRSAGEPGEDRGHVLSDCPVDSEYVGKVEAAGVVGIPPGEDEIRDAPRLARIVRAWRKNRSRAFDG
ncbi:hypothetical protein [Bosea sp. Tri-44]|uniref:hypothetical protein n=1 Tax=Bosea sp. Tri-44 TaxID=1972137 RepID=UPI0013E960B5|nr:hypothetical protein [Bosea sp. Tri-44]